MLKNTCIFTKTDVTFMNVLLEVLVESLIIVTYDKRNVYIRSNTPCNYTPNLSMFYPNWYDLGNKHVNTIGGRY